jgi:Predicted membrane protein (DUF2078).
MADGPETDGDTPLEAMAVGVVTVVTLSVAFGLLALGQSFFWVAFPIGFGGGVPLAVGLARWYTKHQEQDDTTTPGNGQDAALAKLRDRYARGELDDVEFEARVERLLETESVPEAEASTRRGDRDDGDDAIERERE